VSHTGRLASVQSASLLHGTVQMQTSRGPPIGQQRQTVSPVHASGFASLHSLGGPPATPPLPPDDPPAPPEPLVAADPPRPAALPVPALPPLPLAPLDPPLPLEPIGPGRSASSLHAASTRLTPIPSTARDARIG
jgi:hypothetical protein